jgi:hypothetical protein
MHAQAVQRQVIPFQAPLAWAALLAIALLLIGPHIDPYFAQRSPGHQHLGPSYSYPHAHVYDSSHPQLHLSASTMQAAEQSLAGGESVMLPAQEAAPAFTIVPPNSPVLSPLESTAPETAAPWQLLPEPLSSLAPIYADPVKQPPR